MSASIYQKAFNKHFDEFVTDIQSVFPDNKDIMTAKNALSMLRSGNPKILIGLWNQHIVSKYAAEIAAGNIEFFINKDYGEDLKNPEVAENAAQIMTYIDKFRQPIADMDAVEQKKCMTYIQNLTGLTQKHFNN